MAFQYHQNGLFMFPFETRKSPYQTFWSFTTLQRALFTDCHFQIPFYKVKHVEFYNIKRGFHPSTSKPSVNYAISNHDDLRFITYSSSWNFWFMILLRVQTHKIRKTTIILYGLFWNGICAILVPSNPSILSCVWCAA